MSSKNENRDRFTSSEDKTLLSDDEKTLTDDASERQTDQITESDNAPTAIQDKPETEPTEIFSDTKINKNQSVSESENALRPNRFRFLLFCLLFVFVAGWHVINLAQLFAGNGWTSGWATTIQNEKILISKVEPKFTDQLQVGDQIQTINGELVNKRNVSLLLTQLKVGEQYSLGIRRNDTEELREVRYVVDSIPFPVVIENYLMSVVLPAILLVVSLFIFLLKPHDKAALLMSVQFLLLSMLFTPVQDYWIELPAIFAFWWRVAFLLFSFCQVVLLHLFLVFPIVSDFTRRYRRIEWLIYLPALLWFIPTATFFQLKHDGLIQSNFDISPALLTLTDLIFNLFYLLTPLFLLLSCYVKADETGKRRVRVLAAGIAIAMLPIVLRTCIFIPLRRSFNIELFDLGYWEKTVFAAPLIIVPIVSAYAIIRHKVIPVSLVIRRGLQYLFAKNALRFLLILPIVGIIWNIVANLNRTISEILLNNSLSFYLFVFFGVVDGILMRSHLNEWIDRKFFREQFDQEKLLRELIDDVKQSDSMAKLSRLVSSRIQTALHPTNVHFFYEDKQNSDFSIGYTTSESSENMKLAVDSPILKFMQHQREAVDFPSRESEELPYREQSWLKSIRANLLVPMHGTDGKLAGFFSLGEKLSEIPYTGRDKELLETLANQIALVHENLNLKTRVRQEQKIKTEVLSRFDAGQINLLKECPKCGVCYDRTDEKCEDDNTELAFTLPVERTIENRYRLEKLLGKGGMGAVYEATDTRINRHVALKILSGAMFGNKDALKRFEREAQTAGRLQHYNIVTIFDYGVLSTEGAFLVMELVKGESFAQVLRREKTLDVSTIKNWFGQILDGVEAAHKAGIVHRDLKPDNVFVTKNESEEARLCILDFGLARLSETDISTAENVTTPGMIMGTFGYMPPEQLKGEKIDERADLFAVAVMIYESLQGAKPFQGKSYHELLMAMSKKPAYNSNSFLKEFFERGLAYKSENRFQTGAEMKRDLTSSAKHQQN